MKKIINGRLYDTNTAKLISEYSQNYWRNSFSSYMEGLYQKTNGEFFLAGEGGALTKYASEVDGGKEYGEKIIPLSLDEATSWAEEKMTVDEYIDFFGKPEE